MDAVDYSVDPRVIGRFVDVAASPNEVVVTCEGQVVASHRRSWAKHAVVTDPAHVAAAAQLRQQFTAALPDYDALFGVDFTISTTKART
ncbi:hypothetical protein RQN9TF_32915 (plasmid) [Rhodococcus qingshengii]|nr:hypothetical protein RQN9TF_32915 [Rhodococcus qingshengii]